MKKLLLIIAGVILFLPLSAKAATESYWDCPGGTSGAPGTIITCVFHYYSASQINTFSATLSTLGSTEIISIDVQAGEDWVESDKTANSISLTNPNPKQGDIPTVRVQYRISPMYQSGDPCGISITPTGGATFTTPDSKPKNPQTGTFLPYILVGTGAILGIGIYLQTSKKEKFYKI